MYNFYLYLSSKGESTGNAKIVGLPFTVSNTAGNYPPAALFTDNISFANVFQGYAFLNSTKISLHEVTEAGVGTALTDANFEDTSAVQGAGSYFV